MAIAWLKLMEGAVSPYPPAVGDPERAHYQRGFGFVWPVKNDEVEVKAASRGVVSVRPGWHGVPTSERLGASWAFDTSKSEEVAWGNTASYSADVHHAETQASSFSGRWANDQEAYDTTLPRFRQMVADVCAATAKAAGAVSATGGA
jgi:hypothetical protein